MSPRTVVYRTTIAKTVKVRNKVCFHSHYRVFQIDIKSAFILIYIYIHIFCFVLFFYIYFVFFVFSLTQYISLSTSTYRALCEKSQHIYI